MYKRKCFVCEFTEEEGGGVQESLKRVAEEKKKSSRGGRRGRYKRKSGIYICLCV